MSWHQVMVLYTGALYCCTGLTMLVAWKVLGPCYDDHWTVSWKRRAPIFVAGIAACIQGLVILFPGGLVHVENMSPVRTLWVTTLFGAVLSATEFVAGKRAPPPVMQRLQRAFEIISGSHDVELVQAGMELPTAAIGEIAPADPIANHLASPHLRRWMVLGSAIALLLIFGLILHAAAQPLPLH